MTTKLFALLIFMAALPAWGEGIPIFPSDPVNKPRLTAHLIRVRPIDEHTAEVEEIQIKRPASIVTAITPPAKEPAGVVVLWGVQLRTDQLVAASVGVVFTRPECKLYNIAVFDLQGCSAVGFLAQAEAGVVGPKVSLGYGKARIVGNRYLNFPLAGWDVKASALYSWNRASVLGGQVIPGDIYGGLEVDATYLARFSLGLLRKIGGDMASAGWIFVLGVGIGF